MTATSTSKIVNGVEEVCIDLPGEVIQCQGTTNSVKVILRKHRDVIFDINQGDGKTYTVEATDSDFYNARDKKLVFAKRQGTVTFKDGERLPLRVSRGFKGALLLKSGGQLLMRIEPNELDKHQHGHDPKEKPAPIIVALGKGNAASASQTNAAQPPSELKPINKALPTSAPASSVSAQPRQEAPVVCVVEGTKEGMPPDLFEYFKKGGDGTGFSDIDPNHVGTRNWIWGQVAGTSAYLHDNWDWLRASLDGKTHDGFRLVKAKVHYVKGKVRFYFSGYSNANTIFGKGCFGPAHDRIVSIFAGVGKTSSSFKAAVTGIAGSFKANALVSFIFGSTTAIAEWKDDVKKDGYDLASALFMITVKAIVVATLTVAVVAALVMAGMVVVGSTVAVIVVGVMTLTIGLFWNYAVEAADKAAGRQLTDDEKNTDGLASVIAPWLRATEKTIEGSWKHLMEKFPTNYEPLVMPY